MQAKFRPLPLQLISAGLALVLAGCSTNGSGASNGDLYVESCSLGCTNGLGGEQVFCGVVSAFVNQEISVVFSEPVDLASVNGSTFRVQSTSGGSDPQGQFFLDPGDERRLIFRPSLTFDGNGSPIFGFEPGAVYEILIPGEAQGDLAPFVRSRSGRANQSRLKCTIGITGEVIDPVPGPPTMELYLDRVVAFDGMGEPIELDLVTDSSGAVPIFDGFGTDGLANNLANAGVEIVDVWRSSQVWFRFADIMNPATLANPISQTSQTLRVALDADGSIFTTDDQNTLLGSYVVHVDTERLETLVSFTPAEPLPSAGDPPLKLVVEAPEGVTDLVGNQLVESGGGGTFTAIPEVVEFDAITLTEDFGAGAGTPGSGEDAAEGSALWGGGRLAPGISGGAGRLGDLWLRAGESLVLNTDSQAFPLAVQGGSNVPNLLGNGVDDDMDPATPDVYPTSVVVENGVFEFSTLRIENGATLRLEGSNPARIYVRGIARVASGGLIDLSGRAAPVHDSTQLAPEAMADPPAMPLPAGAGAGGFGGDRWDADPNYIALGTADSDAQANPDFASLDGRAGDGLAGGTSPVGGRGGPGNPTLAQYPIDTVMPGANGFGQLPPLSLTEVLENPGVPICLSTRVGGAGAGGAYALDGDVGLALSPSLDGMGDTDELPDWPLNGMNNPPETPGGAASGIGLSVPNAQGAGYTVRTLDWFAGGALAYPGYLRGGSGGGGGGTHAFRTLVGPNNFGNCLLNGPGGQASSVDEWHDHSGAAGGSGGGALQLLAGRSIRLEGQIDASGGAGGSPLDPAVLAGNFGRFAMPGGGGSGGAVRLQAPQLDFSVGVDRVLVDGGPGGAGGWSNSSGGSGSPGLVRIEASSGGAGAAEYALGVSPVDPQDPLSLRWLSVAAEPFGDLPSLRPDSISTGISCWLRPPGNYSRLTFAEDTGPGAEDQGWNLDVLWMPSGQSQISVPFRGAAGVAGFPSGFEALHGNQLGPGVAAGLPSPLVVRFQGARAVAVLGDPCEVELIGAISPILPGSLTPWVEHPALLNAFDPAPNMVRFAIVFDGTVDPASGGMDVPGDILESVVGVTNLRIEALPE